MKNIVFIGAGNLATSLAKELYLHAFNIEQVYSRTLDSASSLAKQVEAEAITNIANIKTDADLYIFSVSDSVLEDLIDEMPHNNGLWIHTAGSMSVDVFKEKVTRFGVIYPFQTFNKSRKVNFSDIPFFIEASNLDDEKMLLNISRELSSKVYSLSSQKRQYIHLTGVFACNFVNDMYVIAADILQKENIPYEVMLPLIDETASKIHDMAPIEAQTGPAVRFDKNVMDKHLNLLDDNLLRDIYEKISEHIYKTKSIDEQNKLRPN